jgi:hypothetical protein
MIEELQFTLDRLKTERDQLAAGWVLYHCWLVQVKPGGTARTDSKYWQVRSRQPMFAGKTLKHLKPNEVEAYRSAIERGRQLKRLDCQIAKLQQQLQQLTAAPVPSNGSLAPTQWEALPLASMRDSLQQSSKDSYLDLAQCTNLAEQERLVKTVLAHSRALRASLRQSLTLSKQLGARNIDLRSRHPD